MAIVGLSLSLTETEGFGNSRILNTHTVLALVGTELRPRAWFSSIDAREQDASPTAVSGILRTRELLVDGF